MQCFECYRHAYDKETRHGTDTFAQQQWDERIGKELQALAY